MKKILLAAMLFITVAATAQTTIRTNSSRMGKWDALTEHYNYTEWNNSSIIFTASSIGVTANDYSESAYVFTSKKRTLTGVLPDKTKYTSYSWDCYDEKYRNCTFRIVQYSDGTSMVSIFYDNSNVVYNYMVESSRNYNNN